MNVLSYIKRAVSHLRLDVIFFGGHLKGNLFTFMKQVINLEVKNEQSFQILGRNSTAAQFTQIDMKYNSDM